MSNSLDDDERLVCRVVASKSDGQRLGGCSGPPRPWCRTRPKRELPPLWSPEPEPESGPEGHSGPEKGIRSRKGRKEAIQLCLTVTASSPSLPSLLSFSAVCLPDCPASLPHSLCPSLCPSLPPFPSWPGKTFGPLASVCQKRLPSSMPHPPPLTDACHSQQGLSTPQRLSYSTLWERGERRESARYERLGRK